MGVTTSITVPPEILAEVDEYIYQQKKQGKRVSRGEAFRVAWVAYSKKQLKRSA